MQALLWGRLVAGHLGPGTGALGDVFFALSTFHALHVLGGLVAIALLLRPRARADARPISIRRCVPMRRNRARTPKRTLR